MSNEFSMGRAADNTYCIQDPHVSRYHAKFIKTPTGLEIADLQSSGGTYVKDRKITNSRINPGDDLRLSTHYRFDWNSTAFKNWYGGRTVQSLSTHGKPFLIGRDAGCDIQVNNPYISRRHAKLQRTSQGLLIEDLNSSGGTWVRGSRITQTTVVSGDPVKFSNRILLDWNALPLKMWLNSGTEQIRPATMPQESVVHASPALEPSSFDRPVQTRKSSAGWIAGSIAAMLVVTFGVLIATDTISIGKDSNSNRAASVSSSSSHSTSSSSSARTNPTSNYTSSNTPSSSHTLPRYSGTAEGSSSSSSSSNTSGTSSALENAGIAVEYGVAAYQGDVIGLIELENEHHGVERTLEATDRLVNDAADGRYGETAARAAQAVDNFADNVTDQLMGGFGGW